MTIANDVPVTVALVAERLGLPSIRLDSARLATDKLLMKDAFVRHGVGCPWYSEVSKASDLDDMTSDRNHQKYVIKPIDGSGARGVIIIDGDTDIQKTFSEGKFYECKTSY